MIGEGPLLEDCKMLVKELKIDDAVLFLGGQKHSVIEQEMQQARCFVQHSVVSPTGDCEGTPVAILEACATGLPVVSTRHAGIPDVVIEGETGFLVNENDELSMAEHMLQLAQDPSLAGRMGNAARTHIRKNFSKEQRLGNLWTLIDSYIKQDR
jgi:glycosyltransferase involved in cell wall biosynthesis